ncbi:MAG TPA: phenylalanine--tRNA ligase subunit alpha [Planctomycetota bacterium]|nr:phenylalanine--tRNA ligase subunit alpha [Planctomycetota bacterium]
MPATENRDRDAWLARIAAAPDVAALTALEQQLLGKKGVVTELVKSVSRLPREERPAAGKAYNDLKLALEAAIEARRAALRREQLAASLAAGDFDPSEPGPRLPRGTLHPITIVQNELVDLFVSLGFTWLDGPEVEAEYYNFEALNIPADHPARDTQDTFWNEDGTLLRTHTSPVQVRAMQRFPPPLKVIVPGRCFRNETVDASHEHTFYQMEGLVVDRGISVAHLVHTMKTCLRHILRRDVKVRLRPGFFPFVEPGFELDANCAFCGGQGCKVCKHSGWIEILPCGLVHPRVLQAGGIDPEEYTGFAFGMGLQRVVMLRYGIDDIRLFMGGDVRFLRQFDEVGT